MATITQDQRDALGGRSFGQMVKDMDDFAASTKLLMSNDTALAHAGEWVAVYRGRVLASDSLDQLLSCLDSEGIPRESSAIGYVEEAR
jgi:hypothetical protein